MLFYIYIMQYSVSNVVLDIANENRYHLHMNQPKKQPQRQPDRLAELPRNDKASPQVSSRMLLGTANELIIEHEGREYRLRLTQNRKLILTA